MASSFRLNEFAASMLVVVAGCSSTSCSKAEKRAPATTAYVTVPESAHKGVARTNLDSPAPTQAQLDRKERSHKIVVELGLPWLESLPVVEDEGSFKPRSKAEVVGRCLATEFCAVRGEGREQALPLDLVKRFGIDPVLSPKERAFLEGAQPTEQDFLNFAWGYEHTHVFLWALGHLTELNPPNVIAAVPKEAALIREKGPDTFASTAQLRPVSEILDLADLYYRIHWAVIELRLKGKRSDRADEEIVAERHRALNWLIRYMNQDWDDVTTDT